MTSDVQDLARRVAYHVHRLRLAQRMRLVDLEATSGICERHLQKVEAAALNLELGTITILAGALDVDPVELLRAIPPGEAVAPRKVGRPRHGRNVAIGGRNQSGPHFAPG